jgi:hypothetical protein
MEEEEEDGKGFLWSVVIITVQAFLLVKSGSPDMCFTIHIVS